MTRPFLDLPPLDAARFASIEDRVARLLGTEQDVVMMLPPAAGGGAPAKEMIRADHCGVDATVEAVRASLAALGTALAEKGLSVDLEGARRAAEAKGAEGTEKKGPPVERPSWHPHGMTTDAPQTLPDGRPVPLLTGDERAMLESWLDFHRATLELKCRGLDDAQVRAAAAEPSTLTLLGLVQHLAEVERNWFQRVVAGLDVPPVYGERNETGYGLEPGRGLGEALDVWRREIARGRELCTGRSLEEVGRIADGPMAGVEASLRWVFIHLVEEYARHNGHADILREGIDGVTGA